MNENYVKIIDNFLPDMLFEELNLFVRQIKWTNSPQYLSELCDNIDVGIPKVPEIYNNQFVYYILNDKGFSNISNDFILHFVEYLEDKLNSIKLLRMKFNLSVPLESQYTFGWHKDMEQFSHLPGYKTAVLYLNDNDGYTVLEDGTKIESVSNRLAVFNGNIYHAPVNATNVRNRLVLNINYIEGN
jgi:hypothetical protein